MLTIRNKGHVAILMGTYNGAAFIEKQLHSIKDQGWKNWSLWVSDDGSKDDTRSITERVFKDGENSCTILTGPQKGFCENFKSLIGNPAIEAGFYAFADQDDIWHSAKLLRAVEYLQSLPKEGPAIYCTRTRLIDEHDQSLGLSPLNTKRPGFPNALLQNIASGNTMVFNAAARQLFLKILDLPVIAHDWALYLIVSACGGKVFFDPEPSVFYRQHNANAIGSGMKLTQRVNNFIDAHQGRNRHWNDVNFRFLAQLKAEMTPENRVVFDAFRHIRDSTLLARIKLFKASGVYHQNRLGQMTNFSYALFNKF
ncbi:glycosyltransferase family 2 protein [Pantoea agglomerans]|uniref:glycosyltransferase family 2 protein n=2 Tax=Pantoea TaxID=53335 RepID=UPI00117E9B8A|nr:glycosyltransferase family 2 protein [Pantoea sp. paga]